jgi:D-alanyl-D-alanine carboxypeptidase
LLKFSRDGIVISVMLRAVFFVALAATVFSLPHQARGASKAEIIVDMRNGTVYHTKNADKRLHPASLTKMMTLYLAFQALEEGTIRANTKVRISRNASSEPPSKFGWRAGTKVEFRYLIRAAAIKSANDAATAIGEALSGGSEAAFVKKMNSTARAMGMNRTTFRNAHGLTHREHLSTTRDMATLARRLYHDYPDYFHLFSKTSVYSDGRTIYNTNRRFLTSFSGATGLKTGYTNAAGYNLAATAEKNGEKLIAIVFGGRSSSDRTRVAINLLQKGFRYAPHSVRNIRPAPLRGSTILTRSQRPRQRPENSIQTIVASKPNFIAPNGIDRRRLLRYSTPMTPKRVVIKVPSSQSPRTWVIDIGGFYSKYDAQKALLEVALSDIEFLGSARRDVRHTPTAWRGIFTNLTKHQAEQICSRRAQRTLECRAFPSSQ